MKKYHLSDKPAGWSSQQQEQLDELRAYVEKLRELKRSVMAEFPEQARQSLTALNVGLDLAVAKIAALELEKVRSEFSGDMLK
jgi:hypothetical protein